MQHLTPEDRTVALRELFAPDPSRLPNVVVHLASLDAYEGLIGVSHDLMLGEVA